MIKLKIFLILFSMSSFLSFTQNDSIVTKGLLFYYNDYFIFYPDIKPKKSLIKTLASIKELEGISVFELCIPFREEFCSGFNTALLNQNENNSSLKYVFWAYVEISFKSSDRTTIGSGFRFNFEFNYEGKEFKISSNRAIYYPNIRILETKNDGNLMREELRETPPKVLRNCM